MTAHALPCAAASLLAVACVAILVGRDATAPQLLPPGRTDQARAAQLAVQVPTIAPFPEYYGIPDRDPWCDANPFVPWAERQRLIAHAEQGRRAADSCGRPPPPPPGVSVGTPVYPHCAAAEDIRIVAVTAAAHRRVELLIRFGAAGPVRLRVGDSHAGWRLAAVQDGAAHLVHATAGDLVLPLGMMGMTEWAVADGGGAER